MRFLTKTLGTFGAVALVAVLAFTCLVPSSALAAGRGVRSINAVTISTTGDAQSTAGFPCVWAQWSPTGTVSGTGYIEQSVYGDVWTIVDSIDLTDTSVVMRKTSGANFSRIRVARTTGTFTGDIGWGSCDGTVSAGAQGANLFTGTEVTDGSVFIPAVEACVSDIPSASLVVTRLAANDYALARTAAGAETYNIRCELGSFLQRTTSGKGIKITGLRIAHQITVAALTSNTFGAVSTTTYVNNTANAVAAFGGATAATMPTATQTNPYLTAVTIPTPAYFNPSGAASLGLEWTAVMANTGVYRVYGIWVTYTKTNP